MSRLVVVSNRTADPRKSAAGGLAVAVKESLQQTGGLWFGWSGRIREEAEATARYQDRRVQTVGNVTLATIDLSQRDYDTYYLGYANDVLWPVFHYRLDLANFDVHFAAGYRRVNRLFAQKLMPLLKPDDLIWVHDYHLIPLAAELRAMGCANRIGFFLHVPMPPPQIMAAVPEHEWLMHSLFAYDLVRPCSDEARQIARTAPHSNSLESFAVAGVSPSRAPKQRDSNRFARIYENPFLLRFVGKFQR